MSFEDCEDRPHHYPNNYLEIQEENKRRKFEEEIQQLESSTRSLPSEINTLKKMVIGLTICFLIFIIYSQYSYGVLRVENERLIKEINDSVYDDIYIDLKLFGIVDEGNLFNYNLITEEILNDVKFFINNPRVVE